jgi:MFS family permease
LFFYKEAGLKFKNPFAVYNNLPKEMHTLFITRIINSMGGFIMPLLTLILTQKVGLSAAQAGLYSTISEISQIPFVLIGGKLVDKIGGKKVIIIFTTLNSCVFLYCAFMKVSILTVIMIIIAADINAIARPAFNTIVAIILPHEQYKKGFSLLYLGHNLGLSVGPTLGALLFKNHLSLLFFIDAVSTYIATGLIIFLVKVPEKKISLSGMRNGRYAYRFSSLWSFLNKNFLLLFYAAAMLIYDFCNSQWFFILPMQTSEIFENGAAFYGALASINAIIVIIFTPLITYLTNKFHPLAVISAGGMLYMSSYLLFSVNRYSFVFLSAIFILTIGEICIAINTGTYVAQRTPEQFLGRVNSILSIVTNAGGAVAPVITGSILMTTGYGQIWLLIAAVMFFGASAMLIIKKIDHQ